jgi:hypothetical protein
MGASGTPSTRNCVNCGRSIAWDANVCQFCGHDYRAQATQPARHEKSALSLIGGALILVAGLMGLALGAIFLTIDVNQLDQYGISVSGATDMIEDILNVCGTILVILGLVAILGGVFGVMRKHFGLVILGGVFGLLCIGPWFLGSLLALVGLILVAVARKDFD